MDTRDTLLNTAEDLARTRGFDGFSFADMADGVGIRKASVHYHFPAKGDLSTALLARYHDRFLSELAAIEARHPLAATQLTAFIDLYRQAADGGQRLCLCVAMSVTQTALPDAARDRLAQFHEDVATWLETVFDRGAADGSLSASTAPKTAARAALAQVEGAQIIARATGDPARFEAAIASLQQKAL